MVACCHRVPLRQWACLRRAHPWRPAGRGCCNVDLGTGVVAHAACDDAYMLSEDYETLALALAPWRLDAEDRHHRQSQAQADRR